MTEYSLRNCFACDIGQGAFRTCAADSRDSKEVGARTKAAYDGGRVNCADHEVALQIILRGADVNIKAREIHG
jgi:hypothetical protein